MKPKTITCEPDQLKLWFATETNKKGTRWLPSCTKASTELKRGRIDEVIKSLIGGEELDPTCTIRTLLKKKEVASDPLPEQTHVLVEVRHQHQS
ncbi:Crinkler effector protein 63 [Phytophthora ramorum]|uniref:Crinkler effector protein 63 n=1 Tax=Phytophthora ramorum TaxID=164328 RepID=UPI0030A806D2|nr:Crinkler effector protein 63 [Phytophthora ramorum]KAH7505043.1 Crinkler effector protein 63 [Phytophthora ramorum]